MATPASLQALIDALRVLPGVGPKSAQRMAFHLVQHDPKGAVDLAQAIVNAQGQLRHCRECNTFCESEVCDICQDEQRNRNQLCVVEMPTDLWAIEASRAYEGLYFVLMGRLSPLDGVSPQDLAIRELLARVERSEVEEVILATNYTTEGEATAFYLSEQLRARQVRVSRIARGLAVGGELEHTDLATLAQALIERRN